MSHNRNVTIKSGNKLDLSGSSVTVTGSLFASSLTINNSYSLPAANGNSGQVISSDGTGQLVFADVSAGSTPGGVDTSIQFNSGSTLSGSAELTYDYDSGVLSGTISEFTTITASNLVAGGVKYPIADGEAGQSLTTDGVGNLSFEFPTSTIKVKNLETGSIPKGTPLYVTASGTSGNVAGVYAADANNPNRMPASCIAQTSMDSQEEGLAILNGFISGVNTSGFGSGDEVYVAAGGGYTNVRPTGSALVQPLGYVEKVDATNGSGVVQGPGHHYILPNVTPGHFWVGSSNGVPTTVASSSFAKLAETNTFTANNVFTTITASHIDVDTVTAREYYTELVSASVIYQSGSTKFGDTFDDNHQFSGSILVSGAIQQSQGATPNYFLSSVGIGTATPTNSLLHLKSGSSGGSPNSFGGMIIERNSSAYLAFSTPSVTAAGILFGDESSNNSGQFIYDHSNDTFNLSVANPTGGFFFSVGSGFGFGIFESLVRVYSGVSFEATNTLFVKKETTRVGIGTSLPNYKLDVIGDFRATSNAIITGSLTVDTNTLFVDSSNNEVGIGTTTPNAKLDVNGNAIVSGSLTVTGTVTELSTKRIKKNIRTMKSQLETISKLNPVTYYRKDTKEKTKEYGFISEEVSEVYPEFVRNEGVNYSKMVSVLVSAVKELKEIVEEQREEIKTLKSRIK